MVKYALLLEKINETYKVVSKVKMIEKAGGYMVSFQKRTYIIDSKTPTFTQFVKKFLTTEYQEVYCVDINNKEGAGQLTWNFSAQPLNASDLDSIMSTHILRELAAGVNNGKEKFVNAIIGFVMGALIVGIIMVLYYTNLIQTMQDEIMDKLLDSNVNFPSFEL